MKTTSDLLAAALADHRAGHVDRAASAYRRLLQADPDNADALHLLGLTERQAGRLDQAVSLLARAVQRAPAMVEARLNLANALSQRGERERALVLWQSVLALDPANVAAWHALGAASAGHGGPMPSAPCAMPRGWSPAGPKSTMIWAFCCARMTAMKRPSPVSAWPCRCSPACCPPG